MKSILITGVSSGIGLGLTREFIKAGYHVYGSVRSEAKAERLSMELGENFSSLIFDLQSEEQIKRAAKNFTETCKPGELVAIINNAGTAEIGPLLHVPKTDFLSQLDTLVVGQLMVIQNFYQYLIPSDKTKKAGKIYNISSISGKGANMYFGCYATGKHALEGLSKTLRLELDYFGIKLIVVAPGNIQTAIWGKQKEIPIDKYKNTIYYNILKGYVNNLTNHPIAHAMTVEEFTSSFLKIYNSKDQVKRYTIKKSKLPKLPFSRMKVRTFKR